MNSSRAVGAALLALAVLAGPRLAAAQYQAGQWRATPIFAVNTYDDATPFQTTTFIGGDISYSVTNNISLGLSVGFSRPEVDGSYFPLAFFELAADTAFLFEAGYQATEVDYAAMLTLGLPLQRFYAYAMGGAGATTYFLDQQTFRDVVQLTDTKSLTYLLVPLGAGVSYSVSSLIGVRLEFRDDILMDFDRDEFNPIAEGEFRNTCEVENFCIIEANGDPPEAKDTVHNFRFAIGFEFTPGR